MTMRWKRVILYPTGCISLGSSTCPVQKHLPTATRSLTLLRNRHCSVPRPLPLPSPRILHPRRHKHLPHAAQAPGLSRSTCRMRLGKVLGKAGRLGEGIQLARKAGEGLPSMGRLLLEVLGAGQGLLHWALEVLALGKASSKASCWSAPPQLGWCARKPPLPVGDGLHIEEGLSGGSCCSIARLSSESSGGLACRGTAARRGVKGEGAAGLRSRGRRGIRQGTRG